MYQLPAFPSPLLLPPHLLPRQDFQFVTSIINCVSTPCLPIFSPPPPPPILPRQVFQFVTSILNYVSPPCLLSPLSSILTSRDKSSLSVCHLHPELCNTSLPLHLFSSSPLTSCFQADTSLLLSSPHLLPRQDF